MLAVSLLVLHPMASFSTPQGSCTASLALSGSHKVSKQVRSRFDRFDFDMVRYFGLGIASMFRAQNPSWAELVVTYAVRSRSVRLRFGFDLDPPSVIEAQLDQRCSYLRGVHSPCIVLMNWSLFCAMICATVRADYVWTLFGLN